MAINSADNPLPHVDPIKSDALSDPRSGGVH